MNYGIYYCGEFFLAIPTCAYTHLLLRETLEDNFYFFIIMFWMWRRTTKYFNSCLRREELFYIKSKLTR